MFSGACPVFNSNGGLSYRYYASTQLDGTIDSFRQGCDFGANYDGQTDRCASTYTEGMFITWLYLKEISACGEFFLIKHWYSFYLIFFSL